jgi:hypothetical protein
MSFWACSTVLITSPKVFSGPKRLLQLNPASVALVVGGGHVGGYLFRRRPRASASALAVNNAAAGALLFPSLSWL